MAANRRISLVPGSTPSVAQRRAAFEQHISNGDRDGDGDSSNNSPSPVRKSAGRSYGKPAQGGDAIKQSGSIDYLPSTPSPLSPPSAPPAPTTPAVNTSSNPNPNPNPNPPRPPLYRTPDSIHSTTSILSRYASTSAKPSKHPFDFGAPPTSLQRSSYSSRWKSATSTPEPVTFTASPTTRHSHRAQTVASSSSETASSHPSSSTTTTNQDKSNTTRNEPFITPAPKPEPNVINNNNNNKKKKNDKTTASDAEPTKNPAMSEEINPDGSVVIPRIEDLLRHPEDLDKIPALKAEFQRKKDNVDAQLRDGLRDQLEVVQRSLNSLVDGQRQLQETRDRLKAIDTLCAESRESFKDFAQINELARIQRNFEAVLMMKHGLETFHTKLAEVEQMLASDDEDLENQPNLLNIHMALNGLRDFRDEAMEQIRRAPDKSSEATLTEWFEGLDPVIRWFEDHLGTACMNLIPLVQGENPGLVVRASIVIYKDENNDAKVKALQEAQKDHEYLASRFTSMNIGPKTIRGYKTHFLKAIEMYAQEQFDTTKESFLDDPERIEKAFKWFFNDLFTVKQGMQRLVPKKWKIYKTYTDIYHKLMHDWLINFVDDPQLPAANMLAIINWTDKYYTKMAKLGWNRADLVPDVIDDREGELVRDWRNLIIKALDEWMERMFNADKKSFHERDSESIDTNHEGFFRTKTLGDMWRMIHEQLLAAGASQRTDVAEGVVDAMFNALKVRQSQWQTMIDEECAKYKTPTPEYPEGLQQLQDWLIAVANDQIACIDDNDESGQVGYLTRFQRDFEPLVTDKYMLSRADREMAVLRDGYVDLSTHCISLFIDLIFSVDFRTTLPEFFTPKWYGEFAMKRMISTFEDYMSDYQSVLHPSLRDILVEEISDELLIHYLSAIRNRGAKFRRQDPYTEKFKDDVLTIFGFFQKYPESFAGGIKDRWRLVDWLVRLLEADKAGVVAVYEGFKQEYWDLQLSWVEAVLRSRDDFERSMISAVKAKAAEMSVERGPDTVMGKVR